ncbi:MAG: DUF3137 domain-containing protein [Ruminococcus sp.]|jgi:hypothetical protein|nr:DUF3137 domain-containing protein [Ruminococcus sp.]
MSDKKFVTAEELEAARQDVLKNGGIHRTLGRVFLILCIICCVGIIPMMALQGSDTLSDAGAVPWVIFGFLVAGIFGFAILAGVEDKKYMKFLNPYNTMYKTEFLPAIIHSRFEKIFAFEPQNGLSKEIVVRSDIFPSFDFIATNDYLRASHNGVNFEYCDMQLQEEHTSTDSDGDTHTSIVTVYMGLFLIVEFDHFVDTPLRIVSGGGKGNVTTESEVFNRDFSVECDSAVDALRILTPQMMNDILEIKNYCKKPIYLAFFDDKIYFRVEPGRDLLEIAHDITKPISESRKQIDKDLDFIIGLLERLKFRNLKSEASRTKTSDKDFSGNAVYQNEQR